MNENNELSRVEKYRKRRNLNRAIFILFILGLLTIIILISLVFSKQKDKDDEHVISDESIDTEEHENGENIDHHVEFELEEEETEPESEDNDENIFIDYVDPSDDNVVEAFIGNWPPIGTVQEGPHTTNFSDGSDDRIEIKRAVSAVTDIEESDMIEWRVENGGEQKVISTVSHKNATDTFRVYLSWIDEEGWQVTKVEKLKENDKK